MADPPDNAQRLIVTVPRRGSNVVQGLPPSEANTNLLDQFMQLVKPQAAQPAVDQQPRPTTDQLIQPTPGVGGAVIRGLAKATGGEEALKARGGAPKLLSAAAPLFDQFMKLVQGAGEAVSSGTVMEKSGELGGQAFMGGLGVAGLRAGAGAGEGQIGTFGGKGARAADLSKMRQAEDMERAGMSPEEIRQKTWWFRDVDKKMKFEIPDKGSKIKAPFDDPLTPINQLIVKPSRMQDLYDHPRLYRQYPDVKHIEIKWDPDTQLGEASYRRSTKTITLNPRDTPEALRSAISHEIQHHIQYEEDFAVGGNPANLLSAAREVLKSKGIEPTPARVDDLAYEIYRRIAGEAEARNVQTRMDYSPETLALVHPHTTLDVPPEKLIVRSQTIGGMVKPEDFEVKSKGIELLSAEDDEVKSVPRQLKWFEQVVSPATRSAPSQEAAGMIREATGQAARDKAITMARLEPFQRTVNAMSDPERLAFTAYVEGRSRGVPLHDPSLQGMADVLRDAFLRRQAKLSSMPKTMLMQFVDDYFPHFWKNPGAAQQAGHQYIGRMGSSASLRKRAVSSIADGISYGLEPISTNPLEMTARYITSMDNFIARTEVVEAAKSNGTITFPKPKQVGASGHPQSGQLPRADLVPLEGVTDGMGNQGYAPEDWARIWNNHVRLPWASQEMRDFASAFQRSSNAITSLELGLSGFHVFTMANEAFIGELARGIANIAGGEVTRGLGAIGKAVAAPYRLARVGHKAEQIYLDRTPGTPSTRRLVDLITRAGGRMVGKEHAADYDYSAMGNFWTAFRRGATKQQLRQTFAGGPIDKVKGAFSLVGQVMESTSYPLFVKYIPKLKNGAAMELLGDWLHANPTATYDEQLAMARRIWDSIDNRFGEVVQDNLFWNRALKQSAQTALRSYSWNLGTIREIVGGTVEASRSVFERAVTGRQPSLIDKLSINSPDFNPKLSYVIALPIGTAIVGMVYQFLKTGKLPGSIEDTQHPQTGGMVPGFGGRGEVPERAALPGYMKDVYGWYHDPVGEAGAKVATLPTMIYQGIRNQDWQDKLIANPNDPLYQRMLDYFKWVGESLGPISGHTLSRGEKTGSNISIPEALLGIRPAPSYVQDPEGYERGMGKITRQRIKREQKSKRRQERQYDTPPLSLTIPRRLFGGSQEGN
jgi:Large polyvalent protein associated domain 23